MGLGSKMEISHEWENGPELLFATVGNSDNELHELKLLEPILRKPKETGSALDQDGEPTKDNRGIFLNEVYAPIYAECSPVSKTLEAFVKTAKEAQYTPNSAFQGLYSIEGFNVLFSAYRDGDHYKAHRDKAKMTALFWLGEKNFEGGDLYLPDFDYTIPYEPNKLIMFPSHYQHEVTPISTEKEGFVRYCASAFIN